MKLATKTLLLVASFLLMTVQANAGHHSGAGESHTESADRNPDNAARDQYRNPIKTLDFFGIKPDMSVVEITPGGGWYTEILAHRLKGALYAAHYNPESTRAYYLNSLVKFKEMVAANPTLYGNVEMHTFDANAQLLTTDDNSADAVLTFRNVHNWMKSKNDGRSFELFFKTLKPGGVLGVVEHRAAPGTDHATMIKSGYVAQEYVIALAESAGFVLEASSEVNANPADTADHPKGVWSLLPNMAMGDVDRDRYLAIGESDRMTLRFRKPGQ